MGSLVPGPIAPHRIGSDGIGEKRNPFGASAAAASCGILIYRRFMHLAAAVGVETEVDVEVGDVLTEFMSGQLAWVYYILHSTYHKVSLDRHGNFNIGYYRMR